MRIEVQQRCAAMILLATCVTLTGCATSGTTSGTRSAERDRPETSTSVREESSSAASAALPAAAERSIIDEILAQRRRGDFPQFELQESGFSITEQVRIGNDARGDYESAMRLLREERYQEGIAILLNVTEATPDATAPYIDLGIAYARSGDLEHAEEALGTALQLSPEHPITHNELGILYRRTGRFAEARASYEKALSVFSDFHYARRNLAVLCDLYLGDHECALQNYRAYLASVSSDPEVEIWIADIENRLGN